MCVYKVFTPGLIFCHLQGPFVTLASGSSAAVTPAGAVASTLIPKFSARFVRFLVNTTLAEVSTGVVTLGDLQFALSAASICDGTTTRH